MEKIMTGVRKLLSPILLLTVVASLAIATGSYAQTKNPVRHITATETATLLKDDPTLSSGFKTPHNATTQVIKPVTGGVVLRFRSEDGLEGVITFVGPKTMMDKGFWGTLADSVIAMGKGLINHISDGGSGGGGGSGGCLNVTVSGNQNQITVNIGTGSGSGSGGSNNGVCTQSPPPQ
jgi:hypothetical protein